MGLRARGAGEGGRRGVGVSLAGKEAPEGRGRARGPALCLVSPPDLPVRDTARAAIALQGGPGVAVTRGKATPVAHSVQVTALPRPATG